MDLWGPRLVVVDRVASEVRGLAGPSSDASDRVRALAAELNGRFEAGTLPVPLALTEADRTYAAELRAQMGTLEKLPERRSQGEAHVLSALLRRGERLTDQFVTNDDVPSRLARSIHGVATGPVSAVLRETVHAGRRSAEEAFTIYERALAVSGVTGRLRIADARQLACRC